MSTITKLKTYIYPNGKYSNIHSNSILIKKYFPEIYDSIKDDYHIKLFMLLHEIIEIPKCANPSCNNNVKLKNIGAGFRTYCCNKCIGEHQHTDINFAEKIKTSHLAKNILKDKYFPLDITHKTHNKNYLIIKNYCKHGDIEIYSNTFSKLYNKKQCLCYECKKELSKFYIPSQKEIENLQENFDNFYQIIRYNVREKWMILNYPKEYAIINFFSKHFLNIEFAQRIYLFRHNLKEIPRCLNCNHPTHFNHSVLNYTKFCDSPACIKNVSSIELEIFEFLKDLNNTTEHKFYLNKNEYDIIVKDKNLLIEFNGLYWHSDQIQKDKKYHYNKWKNARDNNYQLFTIWEDAWEDKKDIIKSMLKYKLNKIENSISARKCKIQEVSPRESKEFFEKNHLQGKCVDSIRLGLFYNDKLVSLMSFGKRKISGQTQFELLRFANIIDTSVIGGASRLFKHFVITYNPTYLISYASLDFSSGNLYNTLSFKKIGETGINYYWVKGKIRYHRTNFMKWKLIKQGEDPNKTENEIMREHGYNKIWTAGNLKYEYRTLVI